MYAQARWRGKVLGTHGSVPWRPHAVYAAVDVATRLSTGAMCTVAPHQTVWNPRQNELVSASSKKQPKRAPKCWSMISEPLMVYRACSASMITLVGRVDTVP